MNSGGESNPLPKLKAKRKQARSQFTKIANAVDGYIKGCTEANPVDSAAIMVFMDRVTAILDELADLDANVEPLLEEDKFDDEFKAVADYKDKGFTVIAQLRPHLPSTYVKSPFLGTPYASVRLQTALSETVNSVDSTHVRVPKLELRKFGGDQFEFAAFWAQYKVAIHDNKSLSLVDKFTYLNQALYSDAAHLLDELPPDPLCYPDAIALLQKKYGDPSRLSKAHMGRLLSLKPFTNPKDTKSLRSMHEQILKHSKALAVLEVPEEAYATAVLEVVEQAIPRETLYLFRREELRRKREKDTLIEDAREEGSSGTSSTVTVACQQYRALLEFLEDEATSLEALSYPEISSSSKKVGVNQQGRCKDRSSEYGALKEDPPTTIVSQVNCLFCKMSHKTHECRRAMPNTQRKEILKQAKFCFRCLKENHMSWNCRQKPVCSKCQGRHHTMMCEGKKLPRPGRIEVQKSAVVPAQEQLAANSRCNIFMQTIGVQMWGEDRMKRKSKVFFDNGSARTYILKSLSRKLKCKFMGNEVLQIGYFGGVTAPKTFRRVKVLLHSRQGEAIEIEALEASKECFHEVPSPKMDILVHSIQGLDIDLSEACDESENICTGLLVGADNYWSLMTGRIIKITEFLAAVETRLGWTVQGPVSTSITDVRSGIVTVMRAVVCPDEDLNEAMQKMWSLESMGIKDNPEPSSVKEDDRVLAEFNHSIRKAGERYTVKFPWKGPTSTLNNNKALAFRRFINLVTKLRKNPELLQNYDDQIRQYLVHGHAEVVRDEAPVSQPEYFMPHHAVIKDDSTTTRLRVVFDASSHQKNQKSLNDLLEVGPNLNPDILAVLLNFRAHPVALVADIEKAFLQIEVDPEDRDSMRFFWFTNPPGSDEPMPDHQVWRMKCVPFGARASSFLLAATIRFHLSSLSPEFSKAASVIQGSLYVDDLITGTEDEESARQLFTDCNKIFQDAGMVLRKWSSNRSSLVTTFEESGVKSGNQTIPLGLDSKVFRVLGLTWSTKSDLLLFQISIIIDSLKSSGVSTKREILRTMSRIFDPVGFLGPYLVKVKILLQNLWKDAIDWDQQLPECYLTTWSNWCKNLTEIPKVAIPRFYAGDVNSPILNCTLHYFCDASPVAYGCVVFGVFKTTTGGTYHRLILSKNRVAPIKSSGITLPRLELMAMILSCRLSRYMNKYFNTPVTDSIFWSDSQVALAWIQGGSIKWTTFIRNRVTEILSNTEMEQWHYCPTKMNVADILTHGVSMSNLLQNDDWWNGPKWIADQDLWPKCSTKFNTQEEIVTVAGSGTQRSDELLVTPEEGVIQIERYGDFNKLLRITAWTFRAIKKFQKTSEPHDQVISAEEIMQAKQFLIKQVQSKAFGLEISAIKKGLPIHRTSILFGIETLIDEQGLLRSRGRFQQSSMAFRTKYPILLPKFSHFGDLLVTATHRRLLHSGVSDTLAEIGQDFWILKARQLIRRVIHKCVVCERYRCTPYSAIPAPMPDYRLKEDKPFTTTGIDFAGPFMVKGGGKAYVTLFTCGVTRAIHLEVVSDLSTSTFLRAFIRFTARRGLCSVIVSDNATTFKRANKELQFLWSVIRHNEVKTFCAERQIRWEFIVPRAPWWGGFYERLVRSVKLALKKCIATRLISLDELTTYFTEIESVINSRPITYVYSERSKEPQPLSPADFLVGERLTTLPTSARGQHSESSHKELIALWTRRQSTLESFWKRWYCEYLPILRETHRNRPIKYLEPKVGDIVLVGEKDQPRMRWKVARVIQVFKGRDDKIRACEVKLPGGAIYRRAAALLFKLEGCSLEEDPEISRGGEDVGKH